MSKVEIVEKGMDLVCRMLAVQNTRAVCAAIIGRSHPELDSEAKRLWKEIEDHLSAHIPEDK